MDVPISGFCRPGLDAVREAFAANFAERGEVGAAVCVPVDGGWSAYGAAGAVTTIRTGEG